MISCPGISAVAAQPCTLPPAAQDCGVCWVETADPEPLIKYALRNGQPNNDEYLGKLVKVAGLH
eukprot:6560931-Karenia_brevis.AAC.1